MMTRIVFSRAHRHVMTEKPLIINIKRGGEKM